MQLRLRYLRKISLLNINPTEVLDADWTVEDRAQISCHRTIAQPFHVLHQIVMAFVAFRIAESPETDTRCIRTSIQISFISARRLMPLETLTLKLGYALVELFSR